jgi:hypothetical protein
MYRTKEDIAYDEALTKENEEKAWARVERVMRETKVERRRSNEIQRRRQALKAPRIEPSEDPQTAFVTPSAAGPALVGPREVNAALEQQAERMSLFVSNL